MAMAFDNGGSRGVCHYWREGRCNRQPCRFLHSEAPLPNSKGSFKWTRDQGVGAAAAKVDKLCHNWMEGECKYGDRCKYLHKWSDGEGFTMMKQLPGHEKAISGITLLAGSNKLFSGSKDESVRIWSCGTGQCEAIVKLGGEIGCVISEAPWLFVGTPDSVKAWNTQTNAELVLSGPVGQVYALVFHNGMLFAGTQDGNILAWRFNETTSSFEPAAALKGHNLAVVTLVVGGDCLYSGSMDQTIKVWGLETLQCFQTLTEHKSVVMSVLCWDQFMISCSLDKTVKVWAATETGSLEVVYTHQEEHGVLRLCGMADAESKPVLLCSCNDNVVRMYDLPSFKLRGKIYSKTEVRVMGVGPGFFFTGDGAGDLKAWKWSETTTAQ